MLGVLVLALGATHVHLEATSCGLAGPDAHLARIEQAAAILRCFALNASIGAGSRMDSEMPPLHFATVTGRVPRLNVGSLYE